jgi:hypothetical protein
MSPVIAESPPCSEEKPLGYMDILMADLMILSTPWIRLVGLV